jgi:antitoxin VapB
MSVQIANPGVVAKIERLAALTGMTKTAAVERAVDGMLDMRTDAQDDDFEARALVILGQLDQIPDRADAFEAIEWDEHGLPR